MLDIATIVFCVAAHKHLHQLALWHEESQSVLFIFRNAQFLTEVVDELFHRIKCLGIACKSLAELFWKLLSWVVHIVPLIIVLLRDITGKVKIMLCLSFVDEDALLLISPIVFLI